MNSLRERITNMFVFNNPSFEYDKINLLSKNIIFIDRGGNVDDIKNYIPCLFIPEFENTSKFLIFFHGNRDDIFSSELFCQYFSEKLKMNVLIVEYPGYSIYESKKSAQTICEDSLIVHKFIKDKFKTKDEDIYIVGRSLGTGPAVYLASKVNPKSLFLISPFKSIKSIKNAFISYFLLDIFKSIDIIDKINCQIFFIHGKNDPLIDYSHSQELLSKSEGNTGENKNILILNPEMTHNDIDIEKDIFNQIKNNFGENPELFPKNSYNLNDDNFKNLFDYPVPIQKHLFKLNISLSNPTKFIIKAKCACKLNDGRVAFGLGNSSILVYNIDWSLNEIELKININSGYPISFITQLKNKTFVACDAFNLYFYTLKKYKYEFLNKKVFNEKIRKIVQLSSGEIVILFNESIKFINDKSEIFDQNIKCDNLIVINDKIIISNYDRLAIAKYINGNFKSFENIDFKTINSINNLVSLDDNTFVALGKNQFLYYNLEDYKGEKNNYNLNDFNPTNIIQIDKTSFLVWNKTGNIIYFEKNQIVFTPTWVNNINLENITSIIKIVDGSLIIAEDSLDNKNSDCMII